MGLPQLVTPQILRGAAALAKEAQELQGDFSRFAQRVALNEEGQPIDIAPMHVAWHRHVDYCWRNGLYCMILAHFGAGKSSGFLVPLMTWLIGNDLQRRIKVVSNDDPSAARRVAAAKRIMESAKYRAIFPWVEPGHKWSEHELFVRRRGFSPEATVQARGVFTTGIGGRADVILFDDVVDQKNSEEFAQRRRVRNLVDQTWMTRLEPRTGLVLWIATPWHIDDATHGLMQTPGWCTLIQRVNADCTRIEQEVLGAGIGYPILPP